MSTIFQKLKEQPENIRYPYISHIRFPHYKNLISGLNIKFQYPITALIGVNGSSKSSVLRAIYGAPKDKSIEDYWFETNVDNVGDDKGDKQKSCFIYGYYNAPARRNVEVIKTRIKKEKNPDYWEPSRPILSYGMEKMPSEEEVPVGRGRSETRWNTIEKNVIFLDFRHEAISAFDRFFYTSAFLKTKTMKTKQDYIRRYAKNLEYIIKNNLPSYKLYKVEKLNKNELLSTDIVNKISEILGKQYSQIRMIEHNLYTREFSRTIYVSCSDDLNYSEAFAGSGEFSVISLVKAVMEAPEKSLILLDEPEVSIHPGAQEKLVKFLAEQAYTKHHQIVYTTHSPSMIRELPPEAIHVLYTDIDGKTNVRSNVYADEAFVEIGASFEKRTIIVEDKVAKLVIDKILEDNNLSANFDVIMSPNGADWIKKYSVLENSLRNTSNVIFILDGDQRKDHVDPDTIPVSENNNLSDIIQEQTGCDIKVPHQNDNEEDKISRQRAYLKYYKEHVYYFPVNDPEEILWNYAVDKEHIENADIKQCFCELTRNTFGKDNSDYVYKIEEACAYKMDAQTDEHCITLLGYIRSMLD